MTFIGIVLLAFSLSLDVAAVSIGAGALTKMHFSDALKISGLFGFFHGVMPLIGYGLGYFSRDYLISYGHYVGFTLMFLVGLKMLKESFDTEDVKAERSILSNRVLFTLAFATSLDALVIGITFNFLTISIPLAVLTIGLITFVMSLLGIYLGRKGRHLVGPQVEVVGAFVLMALAVKVLVG